VLAPGVGFQGGSLEESVAAGLRKDGMGLLLPVSRGISRAKDPAAAAVQFRDQINVARAAAMAAASPVRRPPRPARLGPHLTRTPARSPPFLRPTARRRPERAWRRMLARA
jgi:hypothetical protein